MWRSSCWVCWAVPCSNLAKPLLTITMEFHALFVSMGLTAHGLVQPLAAGSRAGLLPHKQTPLGLVFRQPQQGFRRLACHPSSSRPAATPARAAADGAYPLDQAVAPEEAKPCSTGRRIVFAADGKALAEEGVRWVASQLARKGDTVYLAHVICDPRTPATAVGSSTAATQWSPARDEQRFAREFFRRLEEEATTMLQDRFCPPLAAAGIEHELLLLRLKVHMSAAGIGEAICSKAFDLGADLVVIVSHGAGVLAEYGSVARWCTDHSAVPVMLVPPSLLDGALPQPPSNSIVVAGAGNMEGLRAAFDFAVSTLARAGDNIYVMHAEQWVSGNAEEGPAIEARKQLLAAAADWQRTSSDACAPLVNVAVDVVAHESSPEEGIEGSAGAQICAYAQDFNARCLVLVHHGRHSMMRELQYGPITTHCTKYCTRPLVVFDAGAAAATGTLPP